MPGVSFSSVFQSLIKYFQNLGISVEMPTFEVPESFKKALSFVKNLFVIAMSFMPSMPELDVRAMLVFFALGVPLLIDVLVVWFVNPIVKTALHIVDIISFGAIGYFLSSGIFGDDNWTHYTFVSVGVAWIGFRVYLWTKDTKPSIEFRLLAKDMCNYFMSGIIPGVEYTSSLTSIIEKIQEFSGLIQLRPEETTGGVIATLIIIGLVMLLVTSFLQGLFTIDGITIPPTISIFLPWFIGPFGIFFFILGILKGTKCGAIFILKVKSFSKRWGLRAIMFALDALYIPILDLLVANIMPTKISCGLGSYHEVIYNPLSEFDIFEAHNATCSVCSNITSSFCNYHCNNPTLMYVAKDTSLLYYEDMIQINGITIIFTALFLMIGLPILWNVLITRNREFIMKVNVFGHTLDGKWLNLANRLHSSGIFLFLEFGLMSPRWSVTLLVSKFFIVASSAIGKFLWTPAIVFIPLVHLTILIQLIAAKPNLYIINTILDSVLEGINFLFALLPIAGIFGYQISPIFAEILNYFLFLIPVASISILIWKLSQTAQIQADDPTFYDEKAQEEEDEFEGSLERDLSKYDFEKGIIEISNGQLDSIAEFQECLMRIRPVTPSFKVPAALLAMRTEKMYQYLDMIIDGSTLEFLGSVLNFTVMFAAGAFGWYIGSLLSVYYSMERIC